MNLQGIKRLLRKIHSKHEASLPQSVAVLHNIPGKYITCHGVNPYTNRLFLNVKEAIEVLVEEKDMLIVTINLNPTKEEKIETPAI